jgi:hypothetical protein
MQSVLSALGMSFVALIIGLLFGMLFLFVSLFSGSTYAPVGHLSETEVCLLLVIVAFGWAFAMKGVALCVWIGLFFYALLVPELSIFWRPTLLAAIGFLSAGMAGLIYCVFDTFNGHVGLFAGDFFIMPGQSAVNGAVTCLVFGLLHHRRV